MSYNTAYVDGMQPYVNGKAIAGQIQKRVDGISVDSLFSDVDYSKAYDSIELMPPSTNDTKDTNGTEGAEDADDKKGGTAEDGGTKATSKDIEALRKEYKEIEKEQGWVGKAWNGIKNFFGSKSGSNEVEKIIDQAEKGEISLEAAQEKLNKYKSGQKSSVDTTANILSGLAVVAGVILAPVSFGASLAIGAGVGAAVKVGVKASDAATNEIKGDYGFKEGAKDTITGAVGGLVTAATAGIGTAGVITKETGKIAVGQTIKAGAIAGAKAGAIDGGVMGATNYTANAVFDGDEFTFGGLVSNTVAGTASGAVVGGTVGGVTSGFKAAGAAKAASSATKETAEEVVEDAAVTATTKAPSADDLAAAKTKLEQAQTKAGQAYAEYVDDPVAEVGSDLQKVHSQAHDDMIKAKAEYDDLLKATEDAGSSATKESSAQSLRDIFKNAKVPKGLQQLADNVQNLKNMSRQDVWKAVTGKPGATYAEFKTAYNDIFAKASKEINLNDKANLALRTFFEDLWLVGNPTNA